MVSASEFLKWLYVFKVPFGGNVVSIPVPMAQGGTGAVLVPSNGSLFYSTGSAGALLPTANNGVLVTGLTGLPSISTTLPAGLTIPDYLPLAGGTMTGALYASGMPLTDLQVATKEYVDDVAAGLAPTGPVQAATTGPLAATYYNGPANDGKGATLTMDATGTVTLDGILTVVGQDYLIKDQADPTQNGIYDCTVAGAIGVAGVFTRSTAFDTPAAINKAGITPILEGNTLEGQGWYEINTVNNIGTDPIVFIKFGNTGTVTSITAGTGLTGGVITTSGTIGLDVPVTAANGGTGLTSATAYAVLCGGTTPTGAFQSVSGLGNAGEVLTSNGAGLLPTWQNTTVTNAINVIVVQAFTSSGTYTPTTGMKYLTIECIGPGGGGGGAPSSTNLGSAGGGGAGGYSRITVDAATVGASQSVTVGTGGAGGAAGNNNGSAGSGPTSVGTICVANAGSGGAGAPANNTGAGGNGGAPGTGTVTAYGNAGSDGGTSVNSNAFQLLGGRGGAGWMGGGPRGQTVGVITGGQPAIPGQSYGAGGNGAGSSNSSPARAGAAGANGFVIITEYLSV